MLFFNVAGANRRNFRLQDVTCILQRLSRDARAAAVLFAVIASLSIVPGAVQHAEAASHRKKHTAHSSHKSTHHKQVSHRHTTHRQSKAQPSSRVRQAHHAFVVSSQLRPMAEQLIQERTPQAYAGVHHYARTHTGEASAAAYMALGQAYLLDGKFKEAAQSFHDANREGKELDDYADYLGAKANFAGQKYVAAEPLLQDFSHRYPDSVLTEHARLLLANVKLCEGDPQEAMRQLATMHGSRLAKSTKYLFILARANQLAGKREEAQQLYTRVYLGDPTSNEAAQVPAQLKQMGVSQPFTVTERIQHADKLYDRRQYAAAAVEYQSLAQDPAVAGTAKVNHLLVQAAIATFKQNGHVDPSQVARLSDTENEDGATRLYLLMEEARDNKDAAKVKAVVEQLEKRFPSNRWTATALYSAGNMALLAHDLPTAIQYYTELSDRFPHSEMAALCHWHAAWLNYRLGNKKTAAQLFDEQIERYPADTHASTAIYWRGVIYEEIEKNPAAAAACYQKLVTTFRQYYYTNLARQRLAGLGAVAPAKLPILAHIDAPSAPRLSTVIPENDFHLERARLLANAGLSQYIAPEISASPDSSRWRAYAEAKLYNSDGETWRSLRIMKFHVRSYFSVPMNSIPREYWQLLFPRPYWTALQSNSKKQGLDPYLVTSLIRQESEFNPSVISYADARGLMQLLPSVGSKLARKEHLHHYQTSHLLRPEVNLQLGTAYFKGLMEEFNGHPEYALAAYNAGDNRVKAWLAYGPYASLPEFVESIPFTQTREYVEAILRNREVYRLLYGTK